MHAVIAGIKAREWTGQLEKENTRTVHQNGGISSWTSWFHFRMSEVGWELPSLIAWTISRTHEMVEGTNSYPAHPPHKAKLKTKQAKPTNQTNQTHIYRQTNPVLTTKNKTNAWLCTTKHLSRRWHMHIYIRAGQPPPPTHKHRGMRWHQHSSFGIDTNLPICHTCMPWHDPGIPDPTPSPQKSLSACYFFILKCLSIGCCSVI